MKTFVSGVRWGKTAAIEKFLQEQDPLVFERTYLGSWDFNQTPTPKERKNHMPPTPQIIDPSTLRIGDFIFIDGPANAGGYKGEYIFLGATPFNLKVVSTASSHDAYNFANPTYVNLANGLETKGHVVYASKRNEKALLKMVEQVMQTCNNVATGVQKASWDLGIYTRAQSVCEELVAEIEAVVSVCGSSTPMIAAPSVVATPRVIIQKEVVTKEVIPPQYAKGRWFLDQGKFTSLPDNGTITVSIPPITARY